jgi:GNAT superfamily N-acetyltransferase
MLTFSSLCTKELLTFIQSPLYLNSRVLPISPQRAISQARNPRAMPDDIVLLLAHDEAQQVCGYLGILPDDLSSKTGEKIHVGWLSCIWVDERMRGQGISKRLLKTAVEAWGGRIILTEFTAAAQQLYESSNYFCDLARPKGLRLYLRSDLATILPQRKPALRFLRPLLWCIDAFANIFLLAWLSLRLHQNIRPKLYEKFRYSKNLADFPLHTPAHSPAYPSLFARQAVELQWISQYPWIIAAARADDMAQRYHFSAVDIDFNCLNVELTNDKGEVIAFFMLTTRKNQLKIPYLYCSDDNSHIVAQFIVDYMREKGLSVFVCFQPALLKALQKSNFGFFYRRKQARHYKIGLELADKLPTYPDFGLQDGDGDVVFT